MDEVSLRDHLSILIEERGRQYDQRFQAQEKAVVAALAAAKEAVTVAELNAARRGVFRVDVLRGVRLSGEVKPVGNNAGRAAETNA